MTSQQVPKYHIAPNPSIPPTDAGGILQLGSIIPSVHQADEPINKNCHVRIPTSELFCSHQVGFSATKSRMTSGELGVWARIVGVDGLGGGVSLGREHTVEDVYRFRGVDTIYFNPSREYINESMAREDVREYCEGAGYGPVFMVTGLKTARGPSLSLAKGKGFRIAAELGLQGGLPVELGPTLDVSVETNREMGFEDSTDFIVGIRVKKLAYKKHWLTRSPQAVVTREFNKGATMLDDDVVERWQDEVVDLGGDNFVDSGERSGEQIELEIEEIDGDTHTIAWVVGLR